MIKRHIAQILFLLLILFSAQTLLAGQSSKFIDLDGDGINDKIIDIDNNGIPDNFQKNVKAIAPSTTNSLNSFLAQIGSEKTNSFQLPLKDCFSLKSYVCRSLTSSRSNFEMDFGGGLSASQSSGGGCAGGICF